MTEITLVERGVPQAAILVGNRTSQEQCFAADELVQYVEKISGARLPMTDSWDHDLPYSVYVGQVTDLAENDVAADGLDRDGFVIQGVGNRLYLAGADKEGVSFAVYTFLEHFCGVRWFWPGALGEVVPRQETLCFDEVCLRDAPDFRWRKFGPGGPLWESADKWSKQRELGITADHQREVALWEKRNKLGGWKIADGHAWVWIIPPEIYGQDHPEYFALVNGERDCHPHDGKHGNQLCTSNPDLIEEFARRVCEFLDTHDVDAVSISPNDGSGFCECDQCRALDTGDMIQRGGEWVPAITDRIFTFANEVAERVLQTHPDKYLLLLVYSRYITPPRQVRLHDRIIAQFCMHSAGHWNRAIRREDEERLRGLTRWSRELGIYEYFINGSWPDLPRLFVPLIGDSIRLCYDLGYRYYSPQVGDGFAINGLNYYAAAKLLWDVDTDLPALVADYMERCYGAAAPLMRRYFEGMETAWRNAQSESPLSDASNHQWLMGVFSPQFLSRSRSLLEEAAQLADSDATRQRIDFAGAGLGYVERTMEAVAKSAALADLGLPLFPLEEALRCWPEVNGRPEARELLEEALAAWEERAAYLEGLKNGFELSFFWIRYNDLYRHFNPVKTLRALWAASAGTTADGAADS